VARRDINAPAALSVRDTLYLFPSAFEPAPLFYTTTPETGHLDLLTPLMPELPEPRDRWDPDIFHDPDTDRWYMYFGSSNLYPIYGIELDPHHGLSYIAGRASCCTSSRRSTDGSASVRITAIPSSRSSRAPR